MKKRIAFIVLLVTTLVVSFTGTSYAKTQEFDFSIDWGYWYGGSWGW